MHKTPAENSFQKGLAALSEGRHRDATALFESAMRMERDRKGSVRRRMRYLSYYGLGLALMDRPSPEAIRACEMAARKDFYSAELLLNLGKVYRMAGKTTRALAAFEKGLRLAPGNKELRRAITTAERRSPSPIPWLARNHPLNRFLGRIRYRLVARTAG